ncbi:PREDICTED: uncharacterized protein LOC108803232 [Nanorana parkeri]|uniref:uncharacterized protein LOC108803232 n=1 Tax=Nanorana parkeri TaxID=125878 RepID=UPI00085501D0|nr:PREDICTED: uncharacterized protein LOC108803232 [Nanorana parkeri]
MQSPGETARMPAQTSRSPGTERPPSMVVDRQRSLIRKLNKYLSSKDKAGPLTIYRMRMEHVNCQKIWNFGTAKADGENKVIMMVGETGSGKTTLINTMINFIFGVEWMDDHRIQLIAESSEKSQAHSQTSGVTIYQINHEDEFRIPYSITIIDTPGFGDTRGIQYDEKIMRKIREFFRKCPFTEIDAICFVVQSSLARLTPTQKYIYENISSIFGKDIKENIVFFTTFSDVQEPKVLSAIIEADVPCKRSEDGQPVYFKVNNCMTYANNCPDEVDDCVYMAHQLQWKMGMRNIERFLIQFLPGIVSKDLSLTREVLADRNALEVTLDGLVQKIEELMFKQHELEQTERALEENKEEIEVNERFEFEVTQSVKRKVVSSVNSTNCGECNSTCHHDCLVYFNPFVYFCEVFNISGTCCVCGHDSSAHCTERSYWEIMVEPQRKSYLDVKEKFEKEENKAMTPADVLRKLKNEIKKAADEALKIIQKVARILRHLQEIALKPNPMSAVDYIRLLIEKEKREGKPGFMERIKMLEESIGRFVIINTIQSQGAGVSCDDTLSELVTVSPPSWTSMVPSPQHMTTTFFSKPAALYCAPEVWVALPCEDARPYVVQTCRYFDEDIQDLRPQTGNTLLQR